MKIDHVKSGSSNDGRVRGFFRLEGRTLYDRHRAIETLLPASGRRGSAHAGEEGRHIESLLRDFLNRHLPSSIRAFSGFILRAATKVGESDLARVEAESDKHSGQIDIIVYDLARFPIYERFEEFVVVPPEGVLGVLSVKKRLYLGQLKRELASLAEAARLCAIPGRRGPHLGIYAFTASEPNAAAEVYRTVAAVCGNQPFDTVVNEVTVMDEYVVFKWRQRDSPAGTARFVRVDCIREGGTDFEIPVQRMLQSLLGVYYDPSRGSTSRRPGFVHFGKGTFGRAPVLGDLPTLPPLSSAEL